MRIKNHHLAKLHKGRKTNFEILISEIIGHFNKFTGCEFPTHLNLYEQGKFAVGYYHQRHDLFTSKNNDPPNEAEK
jgi:CRISPR-associated protein Csd1